METLAFCLLCGVRVRSPSGSAETWRTCRALQGAVTGMYTDCGARGAWSHSSCTASLMGFPQSGENDGGRLRAYVYEQVSSMRWLHPKLF